jgi:hypothetical protein
MEYGTDAALISRVLDQYFLPECLPAAIHEINRAEHLQFSI